jgi:hypothetical protein
MGPDGRHKLELNAPRLGWSRDTTAEVLDVGEEDEIKTLHKGSPIHGLGIQVMDPLGRLLEEANSFKRAAVIIADICSLQVGCALESSGECLDGYKFIKDSLMWMRLRTSSEATAIKDAENAKTFGFDQIQEKDTRDIEEGDEDERTERKLQVKMRELQSKDGPPSLDEDKELLSLTDNFHITPSLWENPDNIKRGRGLDQFRVTSYEGETFTQMREDQDEVDSDVEEEEYGQGAIKWKEQDKVLEDGSEELTELFEKLHVTK